MDDISSGSNEWSVPIAGYLTKELNPQTVGGQVTF